MVQYVDALARAITGFEYIAGPRKVTRISLADAQLDNGRCGCSSRVKEYPLNRRPPEFCGPLGC